MHYPSQYYQSPSNQLFEQLRNNSVLEKAEHRFRSKTYQEENLGWYQFCLFSGYLFQLASVLFAYTLVEYGTSQMIPALPINGINLSSLSISLIFLSLVEVAKRKFISHYFDSRVKAQAASQYFRVNYESLTGTLVLSVISIYLSAEGAQLWSRQTLDHSQSIRADFKNQSDSLLLHYSQLIEQAQADKRQFLESVSYQGKINIYNPATAATLSNLDSLILGHTQTQNRMLEQLESEKNAKLTNHSGNTELWTWRILGLSLLCELFGFLCIRYQGIYLGKVYTEAFSLGTLFSLQNQQIEANTPPEPQKSSNTQPLEQKDVLLSVAHLKEKTPSEKGSGIDYIRKYPDITQHLCNGKTISETVSLTYRSTQTVQNVRHALKVAGRI